MTMCGILGIVSNQEPTDLINQPTLQRMAAAIMHRGPDSEGFYINPGRTSALGIRRLSIIDLVTGDQPISNEDGTIWIVQNGEIYNFQALREELEKRGHIFRTRTDTEAILHAYEEYGPECVKHLRGMFALAIWDETKQRLLLARDRLGKKPLYYHPGPQGFSFASELKALLQLDQTPRDLDFHALRMYFTYDYIPAPWSILQGVFKLPPAHILLLDARQMEYTTECYWQTVYQPKFKLTNKEAQEQFLAVLKEAVRLRMISDVPLGALLSGGTDSSLIVALMAEQSDRPIKTFTIGFEESGFDERPYARRVAQRYGTDHQEYIVRPADADVLPKLVWYLDEPMADSSVLPSYYVAQLARQEVTVVLNGDGGDEDFGGYERYSTILDVDRFARIPAGLREHLVKPAADFLYQHTHGEVFRRGLALADQAGWPDWKRHEYRVQISSPDLRQQLFDHPSWPPEDETPNYFQQVYAGPQGLSTLDALLRADQITRLAGDFLVKMDRMTMANSLEGRSPLLDQCVVEFAARLPDRYKVRGSERKVLLRQIASRYVPQENLERKKMGFAIPVKQWFSGDLKAMTLDILMDPQARIRGFLNGQAIQGLLSDSANGRPEVGAPLWCLLILELWLQQVMKA
jgi:asparagine synthase (glutamine-hydrolysing)